MSIRDQIFASDDILKEIVEIPEWGGIKIEVRSLTGADRARILETGVDALGNVSLQRVYPEMVIASAYDPDSGERVFEEADKDGLMSKNALAIDRLAMVATKLSGLQDDAVDKAGNGSSSTRKGGSTSS